MPTLDYEMSAKKSSSSSKKHSKKHEVEEEEEIVKSPTIESESKKRKKSSKDKDKEIKEEKSSKKSKHDDDSDKKEKKSKKKKSWGSSDDEEGLENGKAVIVEEEPVKNPNALENFKISDLLKNKLKSNGIEALFPIQAMTYNFIVEGHDLVGRARTGQGKTLAFVLPILESLTSNKNRAKGFGRLPSGIVLVPTRELAKQVHTDFEVYGGVAGLVSCCVYGGAPYGPQESALRRGVDIVIGTPGRIKDMIEKGTLNLKSLKFRVLDEADEMLNMGFVDDVETILGKVEDAKQVQTLLFSATMPDWVKKIAARFLKAERKTADLVGDEKMKASTSVKHIVIPCYYTARPKVVPDVIQCYSSGGRVIVFTETKNDASELSQLLPGARALHGDIQQSQREVILAGFRSGKFLVLVATDVAARGLDINDVQLIIQCEPPRDVETYIHRSGRTGRAGNTGICVMLYGKKKQYMINQIERQAGVKFEHVSAPQPADIAKATGNGAVESIMNVSDSVLPIFKKSAEELMNTSKMTPVDIIAKALAKIAGYTEVKKRSLLTSEEGLSTLILRAGKQMYTPSFAFGVLRRFLPEDKVSDVRSMSLTADSMNAVFDVPNDSVNMFLAGQENASGVNIELLHTLPELQVRNDQQTRGYGGGHSSGGRGYSNGRSRGGGRGGYSSRGRGRQY